MSERGERTPETWVVLGDGGHARSVVDVIERAGGVVVAVAGTEGSGWDVPVLADDRAAVALAVRDGHLVALGLGANRVRAALLARVQVPYETARPVVARTATVAPAAVLGAGTVVFEHAHVGPGARLGSAVVLNTAAVVEHDCTIGHSVHVAPGAVVLGGATVEDGVLIGSGARLLPGVQVGADAVVGAGAVVRENVQPGRTVVGVPARLAEHR